MTLTNFWFLLIWVFVGGFVLSQFSTRERLTENGFEDRWKLIPAILLMLPYILWAGFRSDSFGDTGAYRSAFLNAPLSFSEWGSYIDAASKDKGFTIFTLICKSIIGNNDILYFLIIACFQLLVVSFLFRRYSCDYWFSVFVFIASCNYLSWTWNGIRQFLAAAIVYATTGFLLKKRYIVVGFLILLAATFHASALLMLPIVFIIQGKAWNYRTMIMIIAGVWVLAFAGRFTDLLDTALIDTQYEGAVEIWQESGDDGMNPLQALVCSIPAILSFVGYRRIKMENDPLINLSVNASFATLSLSLVAVATSGIYLGRLPIYVSLYSSGILLPWEIRNVFEPATSNFIRIAAIGLYVLMFYIQLHVAWSFL